MLELFELQKFSPNYQEINQKKKNCVHTNTFERDLWYSKSSALLKRKKRCTITSYEEIWYRRAIICSSKGDVGGLQALASLSLGVIG